jgi:hypothetical protein
MTQVTLEEVAEQFELWRATRPKRESTPDHLKELIQQLIPHYPKTQILHTLKIGQQLISNTPPHKQPLNFTPIKILDSLSHTTQHTCQIIAKNGATLVITTTAPEVIIKHFLCCN